MDLYAYAQMEDYVELAKANGIEVPRLRGYRLMEDEERLSEKDVEAGMDEARMRAYRNVLTSDPPFSINPYSYTFCSATDRRKKKYLIVEKKELTDKAAGVPYTTTVTKGIRWDLLHGKKRKAVKYHVKKEMEREKRQLELWNRYAGQKNVLYIHARIGTSNWSGITWKNFASAPWFLDGCDDAFDRSYCDIYAKVDPDAVKAGPGDT